MALARGIPIEVAVSDLSSQIAMIRRKTNTLIDYYIYPDPTPSAIAAYDPRLSILDARLAVLDKISYIRLAQVLDNSDALAGSYLNVIIDQLLNAIHGIQELFCKHYDRALERRKPFDAIYKTLEFRESQLKDTIATQMNDIRKVKPEDQRDNQVGVLCRGAIQMINGRDRGEIAYVAERDLLNENHARLSKYGGAYLWWKCTNCEFRLRYHLSMSAHSSIHSTQEVREHPGVNVEYKSAFLVKSHLYQPVRRESRATAPEKYGCVFCACQSGKVKGPTTFSTGRELATHVADTHRKTKDLPAPLLLQGFNVAINKKLPENVKRWDINFT